MKRFGTVLLCCLLLPLYACGGAERTPVSTSLLSFAPEQSMDGDPSVTPMVPEDASSSIDQPPFNTEDKLIGLPLPATRGECSAALGLPKQQLPSDDNTSTLWDYEDIQLWFSRNGEGELLLSGITVLSGSEVLLRGIVLGDSFDYVLNRFFVSGEEDDSMAGDVLPLYRNEQSRDDLLLPPLGTLRYGQSTDDYEALLEYICPAQPYTDSLINGNQADFVYEPHFVLRFYFQKNILIKCEMLLQTFETRSVDLPPADDTTPAAPSDKAS